MWRADSHVLSTHPGSGARGAATVDYTLPATPAGGRWCRLEASVAINDKNNFFGKAGSPLTFSVVDISGCAAAVIAVILPMIVAMIVMLGIFSRYRDVGWIRGMGQAVIPVVMVMMAQLTWDFFDKSKAALGWLISIAMAVIAGAVIYWLGVHPGWVIGAILLAALLRPSRKKRAEGTA